MSVQIRESRLSDTVEIAELHQAAWKVAYKGIIHQSYLDGLDLDNRTQKWKKILSEGKTDQYKHFVALDGDRIVGFADVGEPRDEGMLNHAEMYAIYLHPDYFSRGIGAQLFDAVKQQALTFGYEALYVLVMVDNYRARKFYERMGATMVENGVFDIEIDDKPYKEMKYHWVNLNE